MKSLIILITLLSCSICTFSQSSPADTAIQTLIKIDLGFQGVGLSYEPRLSNKLSVDFAAGLGGGDYVTEDRVDYRWSLAEPAFYFIVNPGFIITGKSE